MNLQTNTIESIMLIGIEETTKNENEINGKGKIPKLVQTFYSEMLSKISNRYENHILSVYTDYESDENGYYTYFIGAKVKDLSCIPEGMVGRTIPSSRYAIITSAIGKIPDIVINEWTQIWLDDDLKKKRSYSTDFELYDQRCSNVDYAQVDIYIAIKD
ncbi:GyrI-like domain-containing protein [Pectinatus brassicae]|uniref:Putative transcriptional regulator YdeE n=1 Tax=Pectinatus brassicae TaxID=862415 RepID=A0A840UIJ3_9FIRM|nr:GyrI-like domain-containing protein [Pectinatus brassicae]MBB5336000.1 putative transcriptional regulator YdeE [Pectinatus brassicae]